MRARRFFLAAYTTGLLIATHWPQGAAGPGAPAGTDKALHVLLFGTWAALALRAASPARSRRWTDIAVVGVIGSGLAAVDEVTQGIPAVGRTPSVGDFLADLTGVLGVCAIAFVGVLRASRR